MSDVVFLSIPDKYQGHLPCQTNAQLFQSPALDIDVEDDAWVMASKDEQQAMLDLKNETEAVAVAACQGCPLLAQCSEWAMAMGQNVFGVAGGLTQSQRPDFQAINYSVDYTERGPLGQVRDDLIIKWAGQGLSNKQIAERLRCNVRTVERRRAGIAAGTVVAFTPDEEETTETRSRFAGTARRRDLSLAAAAKVPLLVDRVTEETAALYDALADGAFHSRDDVIASALHLVERSQALRTAPDSRTYADEAARVSVGARKFLLNRIDIAIRRGRMISTANADGQVSIRLEEETAGLWRSHRSRSLASAS